MTEDSKALVVQGRAELAKLLQGLPRPNHLNAHIEHETIVAAWISGRHKVEVEQDHEDPLLFRLSRTDLAETEEDALSRPEEVRLPDDAKVVEGAVMGLFSGGEAA